MNPERLSILQDLSKGNEIYIEGSVRRPEAVNLDALMRTTSANHESFGWEVYAKKKIGEDITLLKKFTYADGIGKVNVILDLRGELSISEYDLEAGKKWLGEGYLQVSRFSSPIEVTVAAVSLIRNRESQNPQIKGSSNLSNEFMQMLKKARAGEASSEEDQLTPDPLIRSSVAPKVTEDDTVDSPEAVSLALAAASTVFVNEMRKEREEAEKRVSEIQESNKGEIEEINARYAEQITKSNQEHEERVKDLTTRIENLEAEKATLQAEIEQQKQDYEKMFDELRKSGISGEIVSVGTSEFELFTSNTESGAVVKPPEEVEVADDTLVEAGGFRAKDGTFLSPKDHENKRTRKVENSDLSSETEAEVKSNVINYQYKLDNGWIIYSPHRIQNIMLVKASAAAIINSFEPSAQDLGWIESEFRKELKKMKTSYTAKLLQQFKLVPPILKKDD